MVKKIVVIVALFFSIGGFSQQDIFTAARNGTVEDMKVIMKINPNAINELGANGSAPLILACYKSNNDVAEFLANAVNDLNVTTEMGTALMLCFGIM